MVVRCEPPGSCGPLPTCFGPGPRSLTPPLTTPPPPSPPPAGDQRPKAPTQKTGPQGERQLTASAAPPGRAFSGCTCRHTRSSSSAGRRAPAAATCRSVCCGGTPPAGRAGEGRTGLVGQRVREQRPSINPWPHHAHQAPSPPLLLFPIITMSQCPHPPSPPSLSLSPKTHAPTHLEGAVAAVRGAGHGARVVRGVGEQRQGLVLRAARAVAAAGGAAARVEG